MKTALLPSARSLILKIAALSLSCAMLVAQTPPNPTITLNGGSGQGTIQLPNGVTIPITAASANDMGPGGLSSALAFTFRPAEGAAFIVGDVLLLGIGGVISDVIRFHPAALVGSVLTQQVFFYSLAGSGLRSSTGLPGSFYSNSTTLVENRFGATIYTPIAGQPGFNPGSALPTTYRFIAQVPDNGSGVLLIALAIGALAFLRHHAGGSASLSQPSTHRPIS